MNDLYQRAYAIAEAETNRLYTQAKAGQALTEEQVRVLLHLVRLVHLTGSHAATASPSTASEDELLEAL